MTPQKLRDAYIKYVSQNGKRPVSVQAFCAKLKITEQDFYNHFSSFLALEKYIWSSYFHETVERLNTDDVYRGYGAKEKLLTFYYAWTETLKSYRSYILIKKEQFKLSDIKNRELKDLRRAFEEYAEQLVNEGIERGEIKERKYISDKYSEALWLQLLFVLRYWVNDESKNFERTDAAIEKAVDLSFKLMAPNTFDSLVDFTKFVFSRA